MEETTWIQSYAVRVLARWRCFTLAAGTFTIRAVHEGKNALQLSSFCANSKKKHILQGAVTEKKPAGHGCPRGCFRPCGRNGSPGLALKSLLGEAEDPLA